MKNNTWDVVILLGGGTNLDGSLSDITTVRLEGAALLYKNNSVSAIIICGLHSHKIGARPKLSEAEAYAKYLQTLGIPKRVIHLEMESQETLGNLLFTKLFILMKNNWRSVLVIPSYGHSTERVSYLLQKILGKDYAWEILRVNENKDPINLAQEAKSLQHTREINDEFADGDHKAIYKRLMETHPAYKWR